MKVNSNSNNFSIPYVSIESIYQIDTISLQEYVEEYQTIIANALNNYSSKELHEYIEKKAPNFVNLSSRQIKKWYTLAKIQLQERRKIEEFAMKLIYEQQEKTQNYNFFKVQEFNNLQPNFKKKQIENLIQVDNNNKLITKNSQLKLIEQKQSIKLPSIQQNTRSYSNSKLPKAESQLQKKLSQINIQQLNVRNEIKNQSSYDLKQKIETIQIKTQQKPLSKKQFLQMMKVKLNQGTVKDYKTGSFIKQQVVKKPSTYKQTLEVNKKVKCESVYERTALQKSIVSTSNKSSRFLQTPSKSSLINMSTITQDTKDNKESRKRITSTYTARETRQNFYENKKGPIIKSQVKTKQNASKSYHNNLAKDRQKQAKSKDDLIAIKTILSKQTGVKGSVDKEAEKYKILSQAPIKQNKITEPKNQQVVQIKTSKIEINKMQGIIKPQQEQKVYQVQIFKQNDDIYDDEPQKFQKPILLCQQQQQIMKNIQIKNTQIQDQTIKGYSNEGTKHLQPSQQQNIMDRDKKIQQNMQVQLQIDQKQSHFINQNNKNLKQQTQQGHLEFNRPCFNQINNQKQEFLQQNQQSNFSTQKTLVDEENYLIEPSQSIQLSSNQKNGQKQLQGKANLQKNHQQNNQRLIQKNNPVPLTSKTIINFRPKTASAIKKSIYPQYHLQFPTFQHLFYSYFSNSQQTNGSSSSTRKRSFLHILKSLQQSLQRYQTKNIKIQSLQLLQHKLKYSQSYCQQPDQINQNNNIQIKLITQLQFLKNNNQKQIFDIELSSYKEKSYQLLQKLKRIKGYTQGGKNSLKQKQNNYLYYRVVKTKQEVYDIINSSFYRTNNWLELPHGMELETGWNLLWTWSKPQIQFDSLITFQKVNHFINSKQLARKDLLKKNIQKIKKLSKKLHSYFDIIPQTFFLPGQNVPFIKKFRQSQRQNKNLWILKPVGLSRGRGISLVNKLQDVVFSQPVVLQKYLYNPFLLDGYKFDLRIYVLVTSINPLQCYIYRQGFARVSTQKYSLNLQEIGNNFIHLTNYSIQKDSQKSPAMFSQKQKQIGGCKITLKMLKNRLEKMGVQWDPIWVQIQQIVLKSLIACMKYIPKNPNCFQLFGYDIMIDSNMKCWLIQVNSSPSLEKDFIIDEIIKQQLVDDTIQIVDPVEFDRHQLLEVVKRRSKELQGLKSHLKFSNNSIQQLDQDIFKILKGKTLINYGQIKSHSNYLCLAPGQLYDKILKTVQHFTHDPFVKHENFY